MFIQKHIQRCRSLLIAGGLFLGASASAETIDRTFCVWDPVGAGGPVVNLVKGALTKSIGWGVNLKLEAYLDEKVAANDFKAGTCDAALMTDISARDFNHFTGTLNAIGAIPGQRELRTLLTTLSSPKAAKLMVQGKYEVAGILPMGSVFVYVRDRKISNVEQFQGRRMAILNDDKVAAQMVRRVGGSPVNASLSSFSGKFNNGSVDIVFAPAVAFNTMELYKGMEEHQGGILDFPLLQTSLQILIRHDAFPEGYGQHMREYSLGKFDSMMDIIQTAEREIPGKYWINVAEVDRSNYENYFTESRKDLKDRGFYEEKAISLMKKVRCKYEPTKGECAQ